MNTINELMRKQNGFPTCPCESILVEDNEIQFRDFFPSRGTIPQEKEDCIPKKATTTEVEELKNQNGITKDCVTNQHGLAVHASTAVKSELPSSPVDRNKDFPMNMVFFEQYDMFGWSLFHFLLGNRSLQCLQVLLEELHLSISKKLKIDIIQSTKESTTKEEDIKAKKIALAQTKFLLAKFVEKLKFLLLRDSADGEIPIFLAAQEGYLDVLQLLLDIDHAGESRFGKYLYDILVRPRFPSTKREDLQYESLLKSVRDEQLFRKNSEGASILQVAIEHIGNKDLGHIEFLAKLGQKKLISAKDQSGMDAVMYGNVLTNRGPEIEKVLAKYM